MTHLLKTWPGEFDTAACGKRNHEVRKADRSYVAGDDVILQEFVPRLDEKGQLERDKDGHTIGTLTGKTVLRRITYVSVPGSWGLPNDLVVFSTASYADLGSLKSIGVIEYPHGGWVKLADWIEQI